MEATTKKPERPEINVTVNHTTKLGTKLFPQVKKFGIFNLYELEKT